jgi:hypothetical protein
VKVGITHNWNKDKDIILNEDVRVELGYQALIEQRESQLGVLHEEQLLDQYQLCDERELEVLDL